MNFLEDTSLSNYVTMKLGGQARVITTVTNEQDVIEAVAYARANNLPFLVIGEGSNIVFGDNGFDGLVIVNKITGLLIDKQTGLMRIGAGTHWHTVVEQAVENDLTGIEAMALIPGSTGATPINNVGAYGQDISNTLQSVYVYDTKELRFTELSNEQCRFAYRNSIFKDDEYGRYIIVSVTLALQQLTATYQPPSYPSLQQELAKQDIFYPTPGDVMRAVIAVRSTKLPDPAILANTGSFFKNPIVSKEKADALLAKFPDMPTYPQDNGDVKLAAGWLIESAGLRGKKERGIWVYDKQALVLVNESAHSFEDLQHMITVVTQAVEQKFAVTLQPEPEIFA